LCSQSAIIIWLASDLCNCTINVQSQFHLFLVARFYYSEPFWFFIVQLMHTNFLLSSNFIHSNDFQCLQPLFFNIGKNLGYETQYFCFPSASCKTKKLLFTCNFITEERAACFFPLWRFRWNWFETENEMFFEGTAEESLKIDEWVA
jgi:hypothetical protein